MSRKWTQEMAMHLNGGAKFSQMTFDVYCDGEKTGIIRVTSTDGSSGGYRKTLDELHHETDTLDLMTASAKDALAWCDAHFPEK
jgi:hypothetical protein